MTIGIDGNEANVLHKVGVSVYTLNLLRYFQAHASESLRFVVYLRNAPASDLPPATKFFTYKIVWGPVMWSTFFLPLQLWIDKLMGFNLSVFFAPAHYIPRFCPFKTIVTIHDLSYLYFPHEFLKKDLYQLKNWTYYAITHAAKIIAVSKTTKKDLIHEYSIPDEKITVIYNGYEALNKKSVNDVQQKISYPFFLYVGTIQPRKNLNVLITAFKEFHKTNPLHKLIIIGKKGWLFDTIFKQVENEGMKDSVIFTGYISEEEKNNFYKKATALILPSLYEGFGIPLLEAMAHGCPVISSFSSSLPEIGAEACLYFDPKNSNDLLEKMISVSSNKELVSSLILAGKKRIKAFSWEDAGKNTLHILQSICE